MSAFDPFTPNSIINSAGTSTVGTTEITIAATTAAVALSKGGVSQKVYIQSLAANAICYIELGPSTVTAIIPVTSTSLGSFPILPGQKYCLTVPASVTHIATIGTSPNKIYVSCGQGGPV